jgi:hypothetical protein
VKMSLAVVPTIFIVNKNDFHPKLNAPRKMI